MKLPQRYGVLKNTINAFDKLLILFRFLLLVATTDPAKTDTNDPVCNIQQQNSQEKCQQQQLQCQVWIIIYKCICSQIKSYSTKYILHTLLETYKLCNFFFSFPGGMSGSFTATYHLELDLCLFPLVQVPPTGREITS